MKMEAVIQDNEIWSEYMGSLRIVIQGETLPVLYNDLDGEHSPAQAYFQIGEKCVFDLWLFDSTPERSEQEAYMLSWFRGKGTCIAGRIIHFYNTREFQADCGATILDVRCTESVDIPLNSFFTAHGTLVAFVPDLDPDLSKESMWPVRW